MDFMALTVIAEKGEVGKGLSCTAEGFPGPVLAGVALV